MKVVIENKKSGSVVAPVLAGLISVGAGYSFMVLKNPTLGFALAGGAVAIAVARAASTARRSSPRLLIDDSGVLDSRLGVGKIAWSDIEDLEVSLVDLKKEIDALIARHRPN